jgi:hypothetical protein
MQYFKISLWTFISNIYKNNISEMIIPFPFCPSVESRKGDESLSDVLRNDFSTQKHKSCVDALKKRTE